MPNPAGEELIIPDRIVAPLLLLAMVGDAVIKVIGPESSKPFAPLIVSWGAATPLLSIVIAVATAFKPVNDVDAFRKVAIGVVVAGEKLALDAPKAFLCPRASVPRLKVNPP